MNVWLEITDCPGVVPEILLEQSTVREISVLSYALAAAQGVTSGKPALGSWDYSSRIRQEDSDAIMKAIKFAKFSEDGRSVIFLANVSYCGTCYSLRLFFEKSQ